MVKKVERQFLELRAGKSEGSTGKTDNKLVIESSGNKPVEAYLKEFKWDSAKYSISGDLHQKVSEIQGSAAATDDQLKRYTTELTEKQTLLSSLLRQSQINCSTSNWEDFITEGDKSKIENHPNFISSEHSQTVMVVVPNSLQSGKSF